MKYWMSLFFIPMLPGCQSLPSRVIIVSDETGNPVAGATAHPQPISGENKVSGESGKLTVYRLHGDGSFKVNAKGFQSAWFDFDNDEIFILKAAAQAKEGAPTLVNPPPETPAPR